MPAGVVTGSSDQVNIGPVRLACLFLQPRCKIRQSLLNIVSVTADRVACGVIQPYGHGHAELTTVGKYGGGGRIDNKRSALESRDLMSYGESMMPLLAAMKQVAAKHGEKTVAQVALNPGVSDLTGSFRLYRKEVRPARQ